MNLIEYEKKIIVTLEFKKYTMLSQVVKSWQILGQENTFSVHRQFMIWGHQEILSLKISAKKIEEAYMFYSLFTVEKL